jgi:hypothetical protein
MPVFLSWQMYAYSPQVYMEEVDVTAQIICRLSRYSLL